MNDLFDDELKAEKLQQLKDKATADLHLLRLKNVFSSKDGLEVLDWILSMCGIKDSVFTGNSKTYYKSGKQDLGNDILAEISRADIDIHHKLIDKWFLEVNNEEDK